MGESRDVHSVTGGDFPERQKGKMIIVRPQCKNIVPNVSTVDCLVVLSGRWILARGERLE